MMLQIKLREHQNVEELEVEDNLEPFPRTKMEENFLHYFEDNCSGDNIPRT
jgi:hypothetical protein